jgi:hypothetical protein
MGEYIEQTAEALLVFVVNDLTLNNACTIVRPANFKKLYTIYHQSVVYSTS